MEECTRAIEQVSVWDLHGTTHYHSLSFQTEDAIHRKTELLKSVNNYRAQTALEERVAAIEADIKQTAGKVDALDEEIDFWQRQLEAAADSGAPEQQQQQSYSQAAQISELKKKLSQKKNASVVVKVYLDLMIIIPCPHRNAAACTTASSA